jgi:hypothetical protein
VLVLVRRFERDRHFNSPSRWILRTAPIAIDLASPKSNLMRQLAGRNTWNTCNTSKTGTPKN